MRAAIGITLFVIGFFAITVFVHYCAPGSNLDDELIISALANSVSEEADQANKAQ